MELFQTHLIRIVNEMPMILARGSLFSELSSPNVGMKFGDSTELLRYTASALYSLGVSNGLIIIYDILCNDG